VKWAGTFYLVVLGWVLFRAESLSSALRVLRGMHAPAVASDVTRESVLTLVLVGAGLVVCHGVSALAERTGSQRRAFLLWPAVATCLAVAMAIGMPGQSFIYFQF
jgi:hypothetical protein